jgi:N-acetylneuraminate synthase
MKIGNREIGKGTKPFVIAEMSGNHNQSLENALKIVEAAAKCGVDALKIQTYTADTMTLDISENEFFIEDKNSLWKGNSLYRLYDQAHTPWDWHKAIFDKCKEVGIIGFSSPFDATAVDFLEKLDVPFYKIASFENTDLPLIRKVAATKKPVIISTGMANISEIFEAVKTLKDEGCENIILLKCTSEYPALPEDANLLTIPHLRELFSDCEIGLSDHTMGIGVAIASVALGATVIEKHFTLDRKKGGVDSAFSMEPAEMKSLVEESTIAAKAVGKIHYGISAKEKASLRFRRTLYIAKDVKAGETLSIENMRAIRPGLGLSPKYFDILLGKKVTKNLKKGTALSWDLIQ